MMLSISFSCVRISNNSGGSVLFYQGGRHIKRKFAVILRDGYSCRDGRYHQSAASGQKPAMPANRLLENGLAGSLGLNSACEKNSMMAALARLTKLKLA